MTKSLRDYIDLVEGKWFNFGKKEQKSDFVSDETYNQIASYVKQKYPGYKLSALGPGENGAINYQISNFDDGDTIDLVWQ